MWRTFSVVTLIWLVLSAGVFAQTPRMARVIGGRAVMRETPSDNGKKEKEVSEGAVVKVLDEQLPWYVVRVNDRVGWMHSSSLMFTGGENSPTNEPQKIRQPPSENPPATAPPNSPQGAPQPSNTGKVYIRGPRGGCYYYSSSGRKVYVDRSLCN